jgi:2-keto-4-pentenoate hydratase/2-oxohepta-3-ene-1,7-dioic acid hydratase in catechol pathway
VTFSIETIEHGNRRVAAIAMAGGHVPLDAELPALLARWDDAWPAIAKRAAEPANVIEQARVVPQFGAARKVLCAGANYYKHLAEMDVPYTKDATKPAFFFLKPPTALAGPGPVVGMDPSIAMLDWEVEMVAVIGKRGRDIAERDALSYVAGYTVAIDVTARDILFAPHLVFKPDFFNGKGRDGFCPIANGMLPAAFLPDPQATRLRLAVNGVIKQDASTDDMIYGVAELIRWASAICELEPGDLVLTGSPHGVGFPKREFLTIGDTMRAELDGIAGFDCQVVARPGA